MRHRLCIAVHLGENHAGDIQQIIEGGSHVDGVLTQHGVNHQKDFCGTCSFTDIGELRHQFLVHVEASGCIQKYHVVAVLIRVHQSGLGNLHRGNGVTHGEYRDIQLRTNHFQLLDSGRAVNVAGDQQRTFALFFIHTGQLGTVGGFTCALQTYHHDDGRRLRRNLQLCLGSTHEIDQLIVDDFDNLLGGNQTFQNLGTDGTFGYGFDEFAHNLEVYVCFQKCELDFPHSFLNVGFGQLSLILEFFECVGQFIGQAVEHRNLR